MQAQTRVFSPAAKVMWGVRLRMMSSTDLPFSVTGSAAPPFSSPMKFYADVSLRMARRKNNRRLKAYEGGKV